MLMIIALMFISLAALLHVYIFYLEVFAWEKVFGEASVEELAITRFFAYNQGVYNLLLAIIAGIGVAMRNPALMLAGAGSMVVAAAALAFKSPKHRGAAMKQCVFAVIGVVCLVVSLQSA